MFYESVVEGFDSRNGSTNDEHRFIVKKLFGAATEKVLYRRVDHTIFVRTDTKPTLHGSETVDPVFTLGQQLMVNMLVNPTDDDNNPIVNHPDIHRWLSGHGRRYGFNVITFGYEVMSPFKIIKPDARSYTLHRVKLDAVITISDASAFAHAYAHGIGGKRCYGFGLMVVR